MPCRYDDFGESTDALIADNNRLTRVSCDMRTIIRRHGLESELCRETLDWIAEHDKADAERIKEEEERGERKKAKQAALDKLTMDERRMLGL